MTTERIDVADALSACPRCSAGGGFHVALERRGRELAVVLVRELGVEACAIALREEGRHTAALMNPCE